MVPQSAAIGTMPPVISSSSTAVVSSPLAHAVPTHAPPSASGPAAHVSSAIYYSKELSDALTTAELAMKELLAAERSGANLFLPLVNALVAIVNLRDNFNVRGHLSKSFHAHSLLQKNTTATAGFVALKRVLGAFEVTAKACQTEQPSPDDILRKHLRFISA